MPDSGLINKFQKAKMYADQPERIHFKDLRVEFDGNHSPHTVEYHDGSWQCDCGYFRGHSTCSHVMAIDRVLGVMAPNEDA
jgi:hypothetical protein